MRPFDKPPIAEWHRRSVPFSQFQYVDVAVDKANVDVVIPHTLKVQDPEDVNWQVVRTEAQLAHVPGARTVVPFSASNFGAVGGGTAWPVISGNQITYDYVVDGDKVTVWFTLNSTNVVGAPTTLTLALPAGVTPAHQVYAVIRATNAGAAGVGLARVDAGSGLISLFSAVTGAGWIATGAANTFVQGSITFAAQPALIGNSLPGIYRDASASRRMWGPDYIVLRSSVAGAAVRLLLTVEPA